MHDVAIVGAAISGMATAARRQAQGLSTIVFEAHGQPGGCAGYFRRRSFSFDVGATTLVDFEPGGVGGELLTSISMPPLTGNALSGYVAWLPDRCVTLHRDHQGWAEERLRKLGDSPAHRRSWQTIDRLASVFWNASRQGARLPLAGMNDLARLGRAVGLSGVPLLRYARAIPRVFDFRLGRDRDARRRSRFAGGSRGDKPIGPCSGSARCCSKAGTPTERPICSIVPCFPAPTIPKGTVQAAPNVPTSQAAKKRALRPEQVAQNARQIVD